MDYCQQSANNAGGLLLTDPFGDLVGIAGRLLGLYVSYWLVKKYLWRTKVEN